MLVYLFAIGILGVRTWELSPDQYSFYSIVSSPFSLAPLDFGITLLAALLPRILADPNPHGVQMKLVIPAIYTPCAGLAKVSLLLYYRRLSANPWFRRLVIATIIVVAGYSLGSFLALVFGCNPIAKNWDNTIAQGTCIDRDALYFVTGILNIATNGIMLALPIPAVLGIAMPTGQMVGLLAMFVIGGATVATAVMCFIVLLPAFLDRDQTWATAYFSMVSQIFISSTGPLRCLHRYTNMKRQKWLCVEANLFIICAALPTLRRFFRHVAPRLIGDQGFNDDEYDDDDGQRLTPSPRPGGGGRRHHHQQQPRQQRQHHRWYNRFISDRFREYPMRSLQDVDLRPDAIQTVETRAGMNSRCSRMWDARPNKSDGDSEKAIFQTRTMTITYQNRDGSM